MSRTIKILTGLLLVLIALTGPKTAAQDVRRSMNSVAGTFRAATFISTGEFQAGTNFLAPTGGAFYWVGKAIIKSSADGIVNLTNQASTGFTRLVLGTNDATANGIALGNAAGSLVVTVGDGSSRTGLQIGTIDASGNVSAGAAGSFSWSAATRSRVSSSADGIMQFTNLGVSTGSTMKVDALPTVSSGFGTSPSITAGSTPFAGSVNVGTGGVATSGIVLFNGTAFPAAPFCVATNSVSHASPSQAASTTTQITLFAATAWPANSVVSWICVSSK